MKRWLLDLSLVACLLAAIIVAPDIHPNRGTAAAGTAGANVELVQGKGVVWWSRRAVQARKDANARARTIVALRAGLKDRVEITERGLPSAFLCIHRFEGSWDDTRNPVYHGGLQMDQLFEETYGAEFLRAWGHASNWPPFVQVAVAMRAYLAGRGFSPWPNTRRKCGL